MVVSTWNMGEPAAPKPRMPLWGKILTGCGIALLLLLGTCGGLLWWGIQRGSAAMDQVWAEMVKDVEALRTEDGTRRLYRDNPGLSRNYATEEDFLKAASEWRGRLGDIPAQRPSLRELVQGHGGGFNIQSEGLRRRMTYRFPKGGNLILEWEQETLVDLRME